jgi:hypothetical protein
MRVRITEKALKYIKDNGPKFENKTPHVGDDWNIVRLHRYPNVNNGEPVVELDNKDKEFMRLPARLFHLSDIVDETEF